MTPDSDSPFDALLREAAALYVPASSAVEPLERGTLLQGKYRIEGPLGKGGMGAVFRATHVEMQKQVAIKWLLGKTPQAGQRFLREACVTAKIDHPNVVNVFDYGTHQDGRYLVMELLRGESLGARIQRSRLGAAELVEIMIPVLRGLAAAHRAGVIHRDLKPDNVFLCAGADGSVGQPKVLDFGISKLRGPLPLEERLTGQGTGLGTVAYMSPQQLVDATNVDERADIYAAGVMMYEALTGCLPFSARSYNALVLAIATESPRPISALVGDVPPPLERIVMRAMARETCERQPDVQTLIDELLALNSDTLEVAAPEAEHSRRSRWTWALGLPLAVAIWFSLHPPQRAAQPATVPTSRAPARAQFASRALETRAPAPPIASEEAKASAPLQHRAALVRVSSVSRTATRPAKMERAPARQVRDPVPSRSGEIKRAELF